MDQSTLLNLVLQMRKAQKDYFADRSQKNLQRAKSLEMTVDEKLEDYFSPNKNPKTLFG